MATYLQSLAGGILIGLSASFLLFFNGRIAGVSGILGRLVQGRNTAANAAFVAGLLFGPLLYSAFAGHMPPSTIVASWPLLIVAGFLVGFGSRMGSGCTSGHGVLGLARLSSRSAIAVATFLSTAIVTVTILKSIS